MVSTRLRPGHVATISPAARATTTRVFESPEASSFFLGSADLMPRNLDNRVEVLAPVEAAHAQQQISRAFENLFSDNLSAWDLEPDGRWRRAKPAKGERSRAAQTMQMRSVLARARRRVASSG
jgi:polyphosphate kinase